MILLSGGDVLFGIYSIFLFAAAAMVLIFLFGKEKGILFGMASAALLFLFSPFRFYSTVVMTDIPYLTLLLGMMFCFSIMTVNKEKRKPAFLLYALLTAWAGSIRPSAFPMAVLPLFILFPDEKELKKRCLLILEALMPSAITFGACLLWNKITFGSFSRNGYQYWCSVPYDYPELTFSFKYLSENLIQSARTPFLWGVVLEIVLIVFLIWKNKRRNFQFADLRSEKLFYVQSSFALFQTAILFVLYLPYFGYSADRYLLPIPILLIPPALTALFLLIPKKISAVLFVLVICGALVSGYCIPAEKYVLCGPTDEYFVKLDKTLPDDAVVVTLLDPVLASYRLCRKPQRHVVPATRKQEFASKIIAPVYPGRLDPMPKSPTEHRTPALLKNPKCIQPFPFVFFEDKSKTIEFIKKHQVYMGADDYRYLSESMKKHLPELRITVIQKGDVVFCRLSL